MLIKVLKAFHVALLVRRLLCKTSEKGNPWNMANNLFLGIKVFSRIWSNKFCCNFDLWKINFFCISWQRTRQPLYGEKQCGIYWSVLQILSHELWLENQMSIAEEKCFWDQEYLKRLVLTTGTLCRRACFSRFLLLFSKSCWKEAWVKMKNTMT